MDNKTLLEQAHEHSLKNHAEIEMSEKCGCFSCVEIFDASEVQSWADNAETAVCPYCGVDAVIGDASGVQLSEELLNQMYEKYFL